MCKVLKCVQAKCAIVSCHKIYAPNYLPFSWQLFTKNRIEGGTATSFIIFIYTTTNHLLTRQPSRRRLLCHWRWGIVNKAATTQRTFP